MFIYIMYAHSATHSHNKTVYQNLQNINVLIWMYRQPEYFSVRLNFRENQRAQNEKNQYAKFVQKLEVIFEF